MGREAPWNMPPRIVGQSNNSYARWLGMQPKIKWGPSLDEREAARERRQKRIEEQSRRTGTNMSSGFGQGGLDSVSGSSGVEVDCNCDGCIVSGGKLKTKKRKTLKRKKRKH